MKYIPLHGQPCKLYEIHTLKGQPCNYMKYIPSLHGQPCKLSEIHTLTWTVNYMKYKPLHGHVNYMKYIPFMDNRCKLYEIHTPYMVTTVNYMKYIPLHGQPCKLYEVHTLTWTTLYII